MAAVAVAVAAPEEAPSRLPGQKRLTGIPRPHQTSFGAAVTPPRLGEVEGGLHPEV